ncbi:hypothetical protein HNR23_004459 [Nocardiopsis mwathae]|uniref:Transposase Helix-turn-helix domain-containing protein n=1 Tax=Nocardiopsis mwathae TaxID=1472723 RepID=A0A7W9YLL0_9ACTN|nr:transposase family protein [Nocardiopsis mwathae]MBB6174399.1 hypothetical protein [Nocardiopsis mwathae]
MKAQVTPRPQLLDTPHDTKKPLADGSSTTIDHRTRGLGTLLPCPLPSSRRTPNSTARLNQDRRTRINPSQRAKNPARRALLVLVHLLKDDTFALLATGFAASTTTAWRYVRETTGCSPSGHPPLVRHCGGPRGPGTALPCPTAR